jgi:uncharacterized protein
LAERPGMTEVVGTVAELVRYPLKSMAGEARSAVTVDWQGIEGDRQYSLYRLGDRSRFPWLSGRDLSELVRYAARYRDPELPRLSPVEVRTPEGQWVAAGDPALLERVSEAVGEPLGLLQVGRGTFDSMPISLVSSATLAAVDAARGEPFDGRRFRFNIIVESERPDDQWCGRRLSFGGWKDSAELLVAEPIERSAFTTIDPDTAERDPSIMRLIAQQFANKIGIYAMPAKPGTIRAGDKVLLS